MSLPEKCPRCGSAMQGRYLGGLCHQCLADALLPDFAEGDEPAPSEVPPREPDLRTEAPGDQWIGRYRLLRCIGEGGCGLVYEAEQTEPVRRRVALKLTKPGMDPRQVIARFEAERQALARMDHPSIARVLDAGETETGRPYFVMELVPGPRITEFCDQHRLTTRERLTLFIQVCQAIQHAHQKGVIHRDIKPSNVLVDLHDDRPMPKVIDFGIAKATEGRLTDATVSTLLHQFVGTPAYMSPEQAGVTGLDVDTRSDIYSLGVLLYELLTGRPPFDEHELLSGGLEGMCATIRQKEPSRPSTRLRTLPDAVRLTTARQRGSDVPSLLRLLQGDLDWIVLKCLEKDRSRRYETANGLAADLKRHLANAPVVARPATATYRLQKAWQRNRRTFTALAAVGLALLAAGSFSMWQAARAIRAEQQATRRATEARLSLYAADLKLAQLAVEAGDLGRAVTLLDRQRPEPGMPDLRGFEWRYLWHQTRGQELKSLDLGRGAVLDLAFSPDERWLAVSSRLAVTILDVATWREVASLAMDPPSAGAVQFSPDGSTLLTASQEKVLLWDTRNWKPKGNLPGASRLAGFSPNGRTLISHSPAGIQIWDTPTLRLLHQLRGESTHLLWSDLGANLAFSRDGRKVAAVIEAPAAPPEHRFTLRVWDLHDLRTHGPSAHPQTLSHPEMASVMTIALDSNGRHVAASTTLGFLGVWDTESGALVASHRQELGTRTQRLLFRPQDYALIGARSDQTLRSWKRVGTNLIETGVLMGHLAATSALDCSPSGAHLASADPTGVVKLWDATQLADPVSPAQPNHSIPGHLNHLHFLSDGRTLTACGGVLPTAYLSFWDLASHRATQVISNVAWHAAIGLSPDEASVAVARTNGWVDIIDIASRTTRLRLAGTSNEVRRLFFTPDGRQLLTGSPTRLAERGETYPGVPLIQRWDATSGRLLQETNVAGVLTAMAMAPDGETAAFQLQDGSIEVRRTSDFSLVFQTRTPSIGGLAAAYSPDGRWLAVGCLANQEIRVWDVHSRQLRFDLRGHKEVIHDLTFTPDGRTLVSSSHDRTLRFWSIETGQEMIRIRFTRGVYQAAFSRDGRTLAVGTYLSQGTNNLFEVQLLHVPSFEEIAAAESTRIQAIRSL